MKIFEIRKKQNKKIVFTKSIIYSFFCIFLLQCTPKPIINYRPIKLSYERRQHQSSQDIQLIMKGEAIPYQYEGIGEVTIPLKVVKSCLGTELGDISPEEAIEALREEAFRRNVDAVINIEYIREWREVPSMGFINPRYGFFSGERKVLAEFICGTLIIWK
ncbi:MAG: hypothetical protein N2201_02300 [candidate division WOR-3 bacterium]|nr:hypothetical protein [candidate division WOR-3 bacterium]